MSKLLKVIFGNLFLNKGPQDIPFSIILMRLSLLVYFITGIPGLLLNVSFEQAALAMALDIGVLLLFTYLCLRAFHKSGRFVQTVTGLAQIGAIFQLMVLPMLYRFSEIQQTDEILPGLSILLLMLVSWNLAVYAHIFRESFSVRLPAAMLLTICYVFITLMARQILFPEVA